MRTTLTLFLSIFLACACFGQAINVTTNLHYDNINPNQTYAQWLRSDISQTDPNAPIFVWIHGGGWREGNAWPVSGWWDPILATKCQAPYGTILCYMASLGYAVYSLNYTLVVPGEPSTNWPAQIEDLDCALSFLAEQAGRSIAGDPHHIMIGGESAGSHLAFMTALPPRGTFLCSR